MSIPDATRKELAHIFSVIHASMKDVEAIILDMDDQEAEKMYQRMETGLYCPLKEFRLYLDIPYKWVEKW